MEQKGKSGAIRLTNKTAIALRRSAANVRHAWLVTAAVLTLLLACLAVYLGMRWLHAVPVVVAVTVLLDAVIGFHARNRYLQIVGQAICTEAAARNMRSGSQSERIPPGRARSDARQAGCAGGGRRAQSRRGYPRVERCARRGGQTPAPAPPAGWV